MTAPMMPHNLDAEKATLGSVLLNRDALTAVAPWLRAEQFYLERHGDIFAAMLALFARRVPPDARTVSEELRKGGRLESAGGVPYLGELIDAVATSAHIEHYARIVEETALRRRVITLAGQIAKQGYDEKLSADELRADVQALVTEVISQRGRADATHVGDLMGNLLEQFNKSEAAAVSTGLYDLDELIYGLRKGRLITIAGRPSHGKTALALTIACNVAEKRGAGLVFSMEMDVEEIGQRILSMQTGIDGKLIQQLQLDDNELRYATEQMGRIGDWPLYIRAGAVTMLDIRTITLRHIGQHGPLAFVIVDYVGLVTPSGKKGQNRAQEIGEISRGLKALAMEAGCDVLMLAQLNREIEHRSDPIPTLADLRESGDIEQDSNVVIFVVNPEMFDPNTSDKGKGFLYVAKHRGGKRGRVALRFDGPTTRFDNLSRYQEMEGYE